MPSSAEVDIRQRPLARTVYALAAKRFTGLARATSSNGGVVLGWDRGRVVAAKSSLAADALDRVAVTIRLATEAQAEAARADAERSDVLAALAAAAALDDASRQALVRRAFVQRAARIFAFEEGRLAVEESKAAPRPDPAGVALDPRWLIARGVLAHYTEPRLVRELAPTRGARVALASDATPNLEAMQLPAADAANAEALRGTRRTLDDAVARCGSDRRRALALVYILLTTDCLDIEAAPAEPNEPARGKAAEPAAAPERPQRSAADAAAELIDGKRRDLDAGADHFALLGVRRGASAEDVRRAYFELAKKLHPDRLQALGLAGHRHAQRVFAELNRAFGVLSDPASRAAYEGDLARGGGERDAADEASKMVAAEDHARRGEALLRQSRFEAAAAELEKAVELNPKEGEHHALAAWAQWSTAADKSAALDEVLERFDKAVELAPKSAATHYYRGQIAKQSGDTDTALAQFRKVLELRPNHREAALELRLLESRAKRSSGGRLLNKLKRS